MQNKYLEKLQNSSLKITPKRLAIIEIFQRRNKFFSPEEIFRELSKKFNQCGLPSVYRNLESLSDCGILTRIHKFDTKRYYGLCHADEGEHHHHIVCIQCGKVGDVMMCDLLEKKSVNGFKIIDHFVQLDGLCVECQKS